MNEVFFAYTRRCSPERKGEVFGLFLVSIQQCLGGSVVCGVDHIETEWKV